MLSAGLFVPAGGRCKDTIVIVHMLSAASFVPVGGCCGDDIVIVHMKKHSFQLYNLLSRLPED